VVVPDASGPLPDLPGVRLLDRAAFLGGTEPGAAPPPAPAAWDLACVTYTSGTTGPSKGVLVPWGQICAQVAGLFDDFGPDDTVYSIFPAFHLSYRFCIYLSLQRRGRFVARDGFSGSRFWDDIRRYRATATGLTGTMANFLAQLPERDDDDRNPVRELLSFPLPAHHARFAERFGVRLRTCFTSTEICVPIVTDPSGRIGDPASCGRVRTGWPGIEVRLVDANDIAVPPGEMGELVVRTAVPWTMNAGYLDQPARGEHLLLRSRVVHPPAPGGEGRRRHRGAVRTGRGRGVRGHRDGRRPAARPGRADRVPAAAHAGLHAAPLRRRGRRAAAHRGHAPRPQSRAPRPRPVRRHLGRRG